MTSLKPLLDIRNDTCICRIGDVIITMPQPTLFFLKTFRDRKDYFCDPRHGLGRVLVALHHQKDAGYLVAIRSGADINEADATAAVANIPPDHTQHYYDMILYAYTFAADITAAKFKELITLRTQRTAKPETPA